VNEFLQQLLGLQPWTVGDEVLASASESRNIRKVHRDYLIPYIGWCQFCGHADEPDHDCDGGLVVHREDFTIENGKDV
jgi:hypothetical protein